MISKTGPGANCAGSFHVVEKLRCWLCISLQVDAFRGHGFSRFPRSAQSRVFSSCCPRWSRRLPLHSKVFLNRESFLLLKNTKDILFAVSFLFSRYGAKQRRKPYCSCSATHFVAKTCPRRLRVSLACGAEKRRDSRDTAGSAATEETWCSPAASGAVLRNIDSIRKMIYLSQQKQDPVQTAPGPVFIIHIRCFVQSSCSCRLHHFAKCSSTAPRIWEIFNFRPSG
ncbi:hypothetical protein HNQ44_000979 [Planomicrobium koreense]|uniref:Uncharacterized protein n=1 Tax=Planococcus koreensis TaxID=112331 RepID=A0A7W8CT75_9BACL|nr:hypothetical protein [Planococcus koreensis]